MFFKINKIFIFKEKVIGKIIIEPKNRLNYRQH